MIEEPHPNQKIIIAEYDVPDGTTLDVSVLAAAHEWACTKHGFNEGDLVPPGLDPVDCDDMTERCPPPASSCSLTERSRILSSPCLR